MPTSPAAENIDTSSSSTTDGDDSQAARSKKCGLIQCRKVECNLKSHRQYIAVRKRSNRSGKTAAQPHPSITSQHQSTSDLLDRSVLRVERQIEDGFPALPFQHESSALFKELIHHYFTCQLDRLIQIFSPHLNRRKYKSTMVEHALSNDIFCVCITANAKTDLIMRGHVRSPDRASEIVYATTAYILRKKLNNFRPTDLDWLLVLVVALVGFDLAFHRSDALKSHHYALRQLVKAKGGIQAVGHVLPYVLNTDRHLAVFTGQYPLFKQTPLMPSLRMDCTPLKSYGEAFKSHHVTSQLDQAVLDFCLDQCRAIHLMESSHISLLPTASPPSDPSAVPSFLYMRDHLASVGACLHAEYHENQNPDDCSSDEKLPYERPSARLCLSKSRCVLLATLIIDYEVLHANYYPIKGPYLADQLKSVLESQSSDEWAKHTGMLMWILFVAAAVPEKWDGQLWAVEQLRHWLVLEYKGIKLRPGWEKHMLTKLEQFVWAEHLNAAFFGVSRTLTALSNQAR